MIYCKCGFCADCREREFRYVHGISPPFEEPKTEVGGIEFNFLHQKGWECPKCGAVMSPTIPSCVNCTGKTMTFTSQVVQTK